MKQQQKLNTYSGLIDPPSSRLTKVVYLDTTPVKQTDRWQQKQESKYEFLIQRERKLAQPKLAKTQEEPLFDRKTQLNITRFLNDDNLPIIQKQNRLLQKSSAINRSERFKKEKLWMAAPGPSDYLVNLDYFRPQTSSVMVQSARFRDQEFTEK